MIEIVDENGRRHNAPMYVKASDLSQSVIDAFREGKLVSMDEEQ